MRANDRYFVRVSVVDFILTLIPDTNKINVCSGTLGLQNVFAASKSPI